MKCSSALLVLMSCCLLPAVGQVTPDRVRVSEGVMESFLIQKVKPKYPANLAPDLEGPVEMRALIDNTGNVEDLQVISGDPKLVPAVIEAVKQWRYRPYLLNGIPAKIETTIRVGYLPPTDAGSDDAQDKSGRSDETAVPLSRDVISGHLVRKVPPVYPPLARQARIQGTVILQVIIDKEGNIRDTKLVSGHPMLAPAAIEAVKQWKYTPYELKGEIVEVQTDVQVNFKLADDPPPLDTSGPYIFRGAETGSSGVVGGVLGGIISNVPKRLEGERVSEAVMRPLRIQKVDPIYPGVAVQAHIQGTVVLDMRVNSAGNVEEVVRILGHPTLAPAAIEAVKQWKYTPYLKDGATISVVSTVGLKFSLEENASSGTISEPPASAETTLPRIAVPQRVRVSSGVSSGLLVKKVAPEYPPDAQDSQIQGTVLLQARIDKQGNVSGLELISGHPMLAPAAIEAVRQWKYRPYLLNGEAVEVETTIQVNFVLSR